MGISKSVVTVFAFLTALALPGLIRGGWLFDTIDDDCFRLLQHSDGTPPEELNKFMERFNKESAYTTDCQKWGTFGFLKDREQCQTYRCLDEHGSDIFIVNSCANYKKCFDEELDPICAKEGGRPAECQFCLTSLCNKVEPLTVVMAPRSSPSPLTPFVAPPYIVFKASIEKGGGVMSLCNFTFTFMLFLGGVLIRWMMEM